MEEIQKRIRKFVDDRDWDQYHSPDNLAKSIAIEAGELLECFQWDPDHYNPQHVYEELADVMIYCFQMCDKLKVDPQEIIEMKMVMNEKKYPVEKAKGKADKYTEL